MSDKEWLGKMYNAYIEWQKINGNYIQVEIFVLWLYEQYGIVPPERK